MTHRFGILDPKGVDLKVLFRIQDKGWVSD